MRGGDNAEHRSRGVAVAFQVLADDGIAAKGDALLVAIEDCVALDNQAPFAGDVDG